MKIKTQHGSHGRQTCIHMQLWKHVFWFEKPCGTYWQVHMVWHLSKQNPEFRCCAATAQSQRVDHAGTARFLHGDCMIAAQLLRSMR